MAALLLAALLATEPAWSAARAPRVMILIEERNLGTYPIAEAERVLTEHLLAWGIEVVDVELVKATLDRDKAVQAMGGSARAAAALGLQFGADMVIVGKAIAKSSADTIRDTSFRSYHGSVSVRVVRTDTAEVLATDHHELAKIHVDDVAGGTLVIREATTPVAGRLVAGVLARWGARAQGGQQKIQLVIGNVEQVWQISALRQLFEAGVRELRDVVQRSFVAGVAVFDAQYTGDTQRLAEDLTLAEPGHFRLKVLGITPGKLDVRLVESGS